MLSFSDYPNENRVYFTKDLDKLQVICSDQTSEVTVSVSASYTNPITGTTTSYGPAILTLAPVLYHARTDFYAVNIDIKEVLKGLFPPGAIHNITVGASSTADGSADISFRAIQGGIGSRRYNAAKDLILTARPQIFPFYKEVPNQFVPILLASSDCTDSIQWIIYPVGLRPVVVDAVVLRENAQQIIFPSPEDVILFDDYPGGIRAIDLAIGGIGKLRYLVLKDDARIQSFRFRNTFGILEVIHASGLASVDFGGAEYATSTTQGAETETGNDFREKLTTDSGFIGSREFVSLWGDFFRSTEHYILRDGEWSKIIIDEVSEGESTVGKIASFTFSWHLAEQPTGRVIDYGALEPYQYEVPEF